MKRYAITTAVLSTSLTACADPIVGDWVGVTAASNSDASDSVTLPYENCTEDYTYVDYDGNETIYEGSCSTISFEMTIGDDLTGSMDMSLSYAVKLDLEVENSGGGAYKINMSAEGESADIDCTLSDAKNMNCNMEFGGFNVDFEKQ